MSRVSSLKSPRSKKLHQKKRKLLFYKVGGIVIGLILIILAASFLTRAGFLQVKVVEVQGNKIVQKEAIQHIVSDTLSTAYLKLFSKNNRILFPNDTVQSEISQKFSAIEQVALSFNGLKNIVVTVKEFDPKYLWCASLDRKHCYFMDPNGYVFNEAADFSSSVLFTYYGLVDSADPIGKVYLPVETFNKLNSFIESLKLLNLTGVGLNARGEDDFELILSSGGSILFSNREDPLTTFENLETIIAEQMRQDPDFLAKFEYIDVRFKTKAFVKVRDTASASAATGVSSPAETRHAVE